MNRISAVKISVRTLVIMLMLLFVMPVQSASAAMKDADTITLDIRNIPKNAAYIDVLIDFENGENYTKLNQDNLKQYDFDADELAQYNEGGFVSYSCHFKGIKTDMKIKEGKTVFVDEKTERQFFFNDNSLKIAVLDKSGHILQVSDTVVINKNEQHFGGTTNIYLVGDIKYNVGKNKVEPKMFDNSSSDLGLILAFAPFLLIVPLAVISFIIVVVKRKKAKNDTLDNDVTGIGEDQAAKSSTKRIVLTVCLAVLTIALAVIAIRFIFFPI